MTAPALAPPRPATIPRPHRRETIEYELPLSGCLLRVNDRADGTRTGELYAATGRRLDVARCVSAAHVSGWYGRDARTGSGWALAFGAGGAHEALEIAFAGLHGRHTMRVSGDQHGLWVAEVAGSYRAATVLTGRAAHTMRLHRA